MWEEVHGKGQVLEDALLRGGDSGSGFPLQQGLFHLRGGHPYEEETWNKNLQVDCYLLGQEVLLGWVFILYPFKLTIQEKMGEEQRLKLTFSLSERYHAFYLRDDSDPLSHVTT